MAEQHESKEICESKHLEPDYWLNRWTEGNCAFHLENMHISLEKHLDKFLADRSGIKIFFPLCGKTVDMKILADKGHYIVGVDIAEKAFNEFFADHNLEYTEEPLKNRDGKVFTSMEGKIKFYVMSLFDYSKDFDGQFGAIWDRGSLVAINVEDRVRYAELLKTLMTADCRYIIAAMQYDTSQYSGPPFNVTEKHIQDLFGDMCSIQQIDENDYSYKFKDKNLDEILEIVYLLKPTS